MIETSKHIKLRLKHLKNMSVFELKNLRRYSYISIPGDIRIKDIMKVLKRYSGHDYKRVMLEELKIEGDDNIGEYGYLCKRCGHEILVHDDALFNWRNERAGCIYEKYSYYMPNNFLDLRLFDTCQEYLVKDILE